MLYFIQNVYKSLREATGRSDWRAVWGNKPAIKPDDQCSSPRILVMEGETRLPCLFSELWMQAGAQCHVVKSYKINFPVLLSIPKGGKTLHPKGNSVRLREISKQTNKENRKKKKASGKSWNWPHELFLPQSYLGRKNCWKTLFDHRDFLEEVAQPRCLHRLRPTKLPGRQTSWVSWVRHRPAICLKSLFSDPPSYMQV